MRALHKLAPIALFLALFALLVLSNRLDWDQFFSFFEVERRAWLLDHAPPRWSYQLCAGASRLGDPQAFGLSPLFLPILLLGTFWGAKILPLVCMVLGWRALAHALGVLFPALEPTLRSALALFFLFGNYLLWHLYAGHLTFVLIPFSFIALSLSLRMFGAGFRWRHAALFALVGYAQMSAGFYPSVVFFLIPVLLCLGVPALILRPARMPERASLLRYLGALAIALAASSYKWLGVLSYQCLFPRTLTADRHVPERAITIFEALAYQLSPTRDFDFWVAPSAWGPWDVWEYSALSAISIFALALLVRSVQSRRVVPIARAPLAYFLVSLLLYLSFTFGEDSAFSLHHLLNATLYRGSVRVIGRYAIVLQLLMLLFTGWRLAADEALRAWAERVLVPLGYAICALNLAMLFPLADVESTRAAMNTERTRLAEMSTERFVRPRTTERPHSNPYVVPSSYMYQAIARGELVPNCYQPLRRPRTITTEARAFGVEVKDDNTIELVDPEPGPISAACRDSVRVTQQAIVFDGAACPSDLCLNLNALNLYADPPFKLDEEREKYCRTR